MTQQHRRAILVRIGALLAAILGLVPLAGHAQAAPRGYEASLPGAAPAPFFAGPASGAALLAAPRPTDFAYHCNAGTSPAGARAAGVALATGAAIQGTGCGQALLFLNDPATGRFRATFALGDSPPAAATGVLRIFVLGSDGATLRAIDLAAARGQARSLDVDVAGATTLALDFILTGSTSADVYQMLLTGAARARRATALPSTGVPAGATPVPARGLTFPCNAGAATQATTVSALTVPMTDTYTATGCGKIVIPLPPHALGTLALRFGIQDISLYSSLPTQISLRVLDAGNHLLRKAVGLAYLGGGLQPLWVDLAGGSVATLTVDTVGGGAQITMSGLSTLPGRYAPHLNPNQVTFGSASGAPVVIPAAGVVDICNAGLGTNDITVGRHNVFRDEYITLTGCGTAELIMTDTHGTFHGRVGIDDSDTHGHDLTIVVVVLDRSSHPLSRSVVTAHEGQPAVPFSVGIEGASIVQIHTDSSVAGVLFDMTLSGHAVLYDQIFAPSEPPVSTTGGTPIPATAFSITCNLQVAQQDTLLIHEMALEGWSLAGTGCGMATLSLATVHGRTFSARYGIPAVNQQVLISHLQVSVLDAGGKALRTVAVAARAGYGPQRLAIDLSGGARLQIKWSDNSLILFALTTT